MLPISDKVLAGADLDAAVKNNSAAQANKKDPSSKVVAQVVDVEPAAVLANGDADLSRTGTRACNPRSFWKANCDAA